MRAVTDADGSGTRLGAVLAVVVGRDVPKERAFERVGVLPSSVVDRRAGK